MSGNLGPKDYYILGVEKMAEIVPTVLGFVVWLIVCRVDVNRKSIIIIIITQEFS